MSQHLFIPPLPDLGEVKQAIAKFLDASKFNECRETDSPEEFLRSIRQELGILERTFMLLISRPVPLGDQRFYRLRFPKEPLEDFSQHRFGPPPPEFAPFDRCSIKRHPVMYTSANPATCFQEVLFLQPDQIPMQVGYLSEWKAKNGCEFKVVPFVYHELSKASDLHPVVEDVRAMVTNQLAQYYDETRCQGVLATLEYLSRLFVSDRHKSISSYIGHTHLYVEHEHKPDVFMYPSAQANHLRANFAFHPDCLNKLDLYRVLQFAIKDHIPPGKSFEIRWLREIRGFDYQPTVRAISIEESNFLTQELFKDFEEYYQQKGRGQDSKSS